MLFCAWFCQTDTASVLSEAIDYIRFYHEQITVSSINDLASYFIINFNGRECILNLRLHASAKDIPT